MLVKLYCAETGSSELTIDPLSDDSLLALSLALQDGLTDLWSTVDLLYCYVTAMLHSCMVPNILTSKLTWRQESSVCGMPLALKSH